MADCPPTYARMVVTPDAKPRPPGYVDPYHLVLRWPAPSDSGLTISATLWQGMRFEEFRCEIPRSSLKPPGNCVRTRMGYA